jgi:hypothetical protein
MCSVLSTGLSNDYANSDSLRGDYFQGVFKMHRLALTLVIAIAAAFAQNPKSLSKPASSRLSKSFARAGIKALIAVQQWSDTHDKASEKRADEAVDEARAEHDLDNPAEAHMFSKLTYLWIKHKIALLQGETKLAQSGMSGEDEVDANESLSAENHCVDIMETAFRKMHRHQDAQGMRRFGRRDKVR